MIIKLNLSYLVGLKDKLAKLVNTLSNLN